MGIAEAIVASLALWLFFAWMTLLLYWAVVGQRTALGSRLDQIVLRIRSQHQVRDRAYEEPPRTATSRVAAGFILGAGLAALTQLAALSYLLQSPSTSPLRTAMVIELVACVVWLLVLVTDFLRGSPRQ